MALIALLAFGVPPEPGQGSRPQRFGFGGIHVLAVPVALGVAWGLAAMVTTPWMTFLVVGFSASLAYQLVLGYEVQVSGRRNPKASRPSARTSEGPVEASGTGTFST